MARTHWSDLRDELMSRPGAREHYEKALAEMQVGEAIIAARQARGWTQRDLARQAKTTISTVDRIELGSLEGNFGALERIAATLDLKLDIRVAVST